MDLKPIRARYAPDPDNMLFSKGSDRTDVLLEDDVYLKSDGDKYLEEVDSTPKKIREQLLDHIRKLNAKAVHYAARQDSYLEDCSVYERQIRHHARKRCLGMAKWCKRWYEEEKYEWQLKDVHHWFRMSLFEKWCKRWLELVNEPTWAKFLTLIRKEEK